MRIKTNMDAARKSILVLRSWITIILVTIILDDWEVAKGDNDAQSLIWVYFKIGAAIKRKSRNEWWDWEFLNIIILFYALFVSAMIFSRKWVIFQKSFSIKLFHFPIFDSNFKWVEKQFSNFSYLACCEIELFSKKNLMENNV